MKNKFKKSDAKGNKLPEEIGKGINQDHLENVQKHRGLETTVSYRAKQGDVMDFQLTCKRDGLNPSLVLRELMNNYTKNNS
jgi:hypothetical protein